MRDYKEREIKTLTLTLSTTGQFDELTVNFIDGESGDTSRITVPYSPEEHPEFNERVGNEIYWWVNEYMNKNDTIKQLSLRRYEQMRKIYLNNDDAIREVIDTWGVENVNKGYTIFDYDGTGMLQIEAIGDVWGDDSDDEAMVEQAIKDGIKIIPVDELPEKFDRRYLGWIDTPENRQKIAEYTKEWIKWNEG